MRRMGVVAGRQRVADARPIALRLMHLMGTVVTFIILWPLAVVCAIAVKLESGGPVFVNENGLRFRTLGCNGKLTRLGRFLRKSELDALPQLFSPA